MRVVLIWALWVLLAAVPVGIAMTSQYLAWRGPEYIIGGFAGIIALCLLLFQPLMAARWLPGLRPRRARQVHLWLGRSLVLLVAVHVGGLYLTSPPDTLDALTFTAPTWFSVFGVTAMWGVFLTAFLVILRHRVPATGWLWVHNGLAWFVVLATVAHALLIEGAMGPVSKTVLCAAVVTVTTAVMLRLRVFARTAKRA